MTFVRCCGSEGPKEHHADKFATFALDHLNDVRKKVAHLRKLERLLAKTVAQCTGTTAPECPVLDILDVQRSKQLLKG